MNIANILPLPLNTFVQDVPARQYYDFELGPESTYPLKGVTYPVDYGHILGYTAEDGHELDLFVGNDIDGCCGHVLVFRGEENPKEHKFFVGLKDDELSQILKELQPVLIQHESYATMEELLKTIEKFKD